MKTLLRNLGLAALLSLGFWVVIGLLVGTFYLANWLLSTTGYIIVLVVLVFIISLLTVYLEP